MCSTSPDTAESLADADSGHRRLIRCRVLGHRIWFVDDPARPLDVTRGCVRCHDPATFRTLVTVNDDPARPGFVQVEGAERLVGFLEGLR